MNRMYRTTLSRMGGLLVIVLMLAGPAVAQDANDDRHTIVIEIGDDDPVVIIDGERLSDEEARAYLEEHGLGLDEDAFHLDPSGTVRVLRRGDRPDAMHELLRRHTAEGPHTFRFRGDDDFTFFMDDVRDGLFSGQAFLGGDGPFREMGALMEERAEIAKMDAESRRLAREVQAAEGAERTRLETELRQKLDEVFARKQALREARITHMQEQLDELQEEYQQRQRAEAEIIERRLKELLGETDMYDW